MKIKKITFFFAQLNTPNLCTGGELRGQVILNKFEKDPNFKTQVVIPKISNRSFNSKSKLIIGKNFFEKRIKRHNSLSSFIVFITRTIELLKKESKIKTDILYSTGDFFCNIIPSALIKSKRSKTKFIVCIHHIIQNPFQRKSNFLIANIVSFLIQRLSFSIIKRKADLIFVMNDQVKNFLIKRNFKNKIIIVGNGLDIKYLKKITSPFKKTKALNEISYFGRLSATKGVFDFPKILNEVKKTYPNIHLNLIGTVSPNIKRILEQEFSLIGCQENYTIHGFIPKLKDVFKIISTSKVIVFPSYEEGWGISLFQSTFLKKPIVAYNLPVFQKLFQKKLTTVPIGDVSAMSKKVSYFIKNHSKKETKEYIDSCYSITKKYNWQKVYLNEKKNIVNLFKNETS